jgi:hypothetical protein
MDCSTEKALDSDAHTADSTRKLWTRPNIASLSIARTANADAPGDFEIDFVFFQFGDCGDPGGDCIDLGSL